MSLAVWRTALIRLHEIKPIFQTLKDSISQKCHTFIIFCYKSCCVQAITWSRGHLPKNVVTLNFCTVSISLIMMQLCWDLSLAKTFLRYKYSADISEFPPIYYVQDFGNSCMLHNAIRKLFGRFILLFQEIKEAIGFSHTNRSFCPTGVSFYAEDFQSKTAAMLYINTWLVVQP